MYQRLDKRVARLIADSGPSLVGGLKGLEKEALRVTADGRVSQASHPAGLGAALTHPWITTDYSEALLEFVTPPRADIFECLEFLTDIHRYTYDYLPEGELLWATSMPCIVEGDRSIPIARFGNSNPGLMKHIYRQGSRPPVRPGYAGHFRYPLQLLSAREFLGCLRGAGRAPW